MDIVNNIDQAIILFDEQGTPTFRPDRETNYFLGVAITYDYSDEDEIFNQCDKLLRLSNKKPLENRHLSINRVTEISDRLLNLPIQIVVTSLDLSNTEFEQVAKVYEEFGNVMRDKYRNIRERPLAHAIHTRIVDECIFTSITDYAERKRKNILFSIFLDDWAIPQSDVNIYLNERSLSFETRLNDLFRQFNFPFKIMVPSISLLKTDNNYKRLIGVITSVISRGFLNKTDRRYSNSPLNLISNSKSNKYFDITNKTLEFFRKFMDDASRNPPKF